MEQDIIELFIDEDNDFAGIEAISIVEYPAIEEDFIALKEQQIQLAEVDSEKRILMGAALIPDRKIFRKSGDKEYFIYFSKDTVRQASELFLSKGKQNNSTLEHDVELKGLSVVESWIIEDEQKDKSAKYNLNLPVGTWMVSVKVNNDKIWEEFVKEGKVKGFSIEGFFTDKLDERPRESVREEVDSEEFEALAKLFELEDIVLSQWGVELETYNDYPQAARNNAKRALDYKKKNGSSCGTPVGWRRASQLASGANISRSTIARMASFKRHQQNKDVPYSEGCGGIMWDAWGGSAGVNWAINKLKKIDKLSEDFVPVNDDYIIINDRLAYSTKEQAEKMAKDLKCEGFHVHEIDDKEWFMPCKEHFLAEVGPKGGIRKSPKAPKSDTPNKNPKGKGSAGGSAKGKTGAKVSAKDRATLQKKADDFNKRYKEKLGYGVTVGMLASVFQRGLGAFNTSHSPNVKSASQWAFARTNAFLYLVKNGRPQNPKYTTDYDLLPKKHPKSPK
tara:strand:+ start:10307 stop:11821 length:1515 start_codon:yes stop_codon:yes gene_type:complete